MRIEEARWIDLCLARHAPAIDPQSPSPSPSQPVLLNLGSGTAQARERAKPYIDQLTLAPLRGKGWRIVHSDLQQGEGIDLSGDMFDPAFQQQLQALQPGLVMFCNVFEHLPAKLRAQAPATLERILAPGGLLLITVPRSYPYHADPIDTLYRPTPQEVAALFPRMEVIETQVVDSESYGDEFLRGSLWRRTRKVLRLLFPFVRPKRWLSHAHRFFWLHRPYQLSCLLLRKPFDAPRNAAPNETAGDSLALQSAP